MLNKKKDDDSDDDSDDDEANLAEGPIYFGRDDEEEMSKKSNLEIEKIQYERHLQRRRDLDRKRAEVILLLLLWSKILEIVFLLEKKNLNTQKKKNSNSISSHNIF